MTVTRVGNWRPHPSQLFPDLDIFAADIPLPLPAPAEIPSEAAADVRSQSLEPLVLEGDGSAVLIDSNGTIVDVGTLCKTMAEYLVEVQLRWTPRTHPDYPNGNATWEQLVAFTHNTRCTSCIRLLLCAAGLLTSVHMPRAGQLADSSIIQRSTMQCSLSILPLSSAACQSLRCPYYCHTTRRMACCACIHWTHALRSYMLTRGTAPTALSKEQ
jgi:hypothetical protein